MQNLRSVALNAAQRFESSERWLHRVVILLSLALALLPAITAFTIHFDSSRIHIGLETIVGVVAALVYWSLRAVSAASLWWVASARIGTLTERPAALPPNTEIVNVEASSIAELASYVDVHYPTGLVSELHLNTRREMYESWHENSPHFARLVVQKHRGKNRSTGCCILLPISPETFARYRNGFGTPDCWTTPDRTASPECVVLFMPALHCQKVLKSSAVSSVLAELFVSLAASHVRDVAKTVLVAPVHTDATRANVRALGFEMFRHSRAGFELWELDGRRLSELSKDAKRTFAVIRARSVAVGADRAPAA